MRPIRSILLILMLVWIVPTSAQDDTALPVITPENADQLVMAWEFSGHEFAVNDIDFSTDGQYIASAGSDINTRLWNLTTGENEQTINAQLIEVRSVDISPDDKSILTTGFNGFAFLWDIRSETRADSLNAENYPSLSDGEFSPDGTQLAIAAGDGTVQIFERDDLRLLEKFVADALVVERVVFSPDGTQIAAGIGFPADHTMVWDIESGELLHDFTGHVGTVFGVAYSPDGAILATGGGDGTVRLWDIESGDELAVIQAHDEDVFDLTFSPDGSMIATAGYEGLVRLWDAESGEMLAEYKGDESERSVLAVKFNTDGTQLAFGGESGLLWVFEVAAE